VDRHVDEGRGEQVAITYDSAYTGEKQQYTYKELQKKVGALASILKSKFDI
jgi:propionyl-CoA synthetase